MHRPRSARSAGQGPDATPFGQQIAASRAATVAAIRSVCTSQPATSSAACDAAVDGVPARAGRKVATRCARRRRVARRRLARRRGGAGSRAAAPLQRGSADQDGEHRVALLRHRRRSAAPLPAGSLTSAISGRRSTSMSLAIWPEGVGLVDQRVADRGDRRATGVPGRRRSQRQFTGQRGRPVETIGSSASSAIAASVPAAPPHCTGKPLRATTIAVQRVQHAVQPPGRLEAEGDRHGVLGQRPAGHHRLRGARSASAASAATCARDHRRSWSRADRAHSISAVSSTSWLVRPCAATARPRHRAAGRAAAPPSG